MVLRRMTEKIKQVCIFPQPELKLKDSKGCAECNGPDCLKTFNKSAKHSRITSPGKLIQFGTGRSKCLQQNLYFHERFR